MIRMHVTTFHCAFHVTLYCKVTKSSFFCYRCSIRSYHKRVSVTTNSLFDRYPPWYFFLKKQMVVVVCNSSAWYHHVTLISTKLLSVPCLKGVVSLCKVKPIRQHSGHCTACSCFHNYIFEKMLV